MRFYIEYSDYRDVSENMDWPFTHFTPKEMACRKTDQLKVSKTFMWRLQIIRAKLGHPLRVTSGYRDPQYNAEVSTTGLTGPHTTGHAVDIQVWGRLARALVREAIALGMTGVGIKQHGTFHERFIHLDDLPAGRGINRPYMWSYE